MRFKINLVTRTYLDQQLVSRIGTAVTIILVVAGAWNLLRVTCNMGEMKRLATDTVLQEGRLNKATAGVQEKEAARQQDRIKFYNEIIARKCFNWLETLDKIEGMTPEGVAVTQLAPDMKTGSVKIQANARSFAQVRTYMERLDGSKDFSDIMLLSHKDVMAGATGRGVQFALSVRVVMP